MNPSIRRAAADQFVQGLQSTGGPLEIHRIGERVVVETPNLRLIGFEALPDISGGENSTEKTNPTFHRRE